MSWSRVGSRFPSSVTNPRPISFPNQWWIQDFPEGAPTPKVVVLTYFLAKNYMKMKEFGPLVGASLAPPLDLPLQTVKISIKLKKCYPWEPILFLCKSTRVGGQGNEINMSGDIYIHQSSLRKIILQCLSKLFL